MIRSRSATGMGKPYSGCISDSEIVGAAAPPEPASPAEGGRQESRIAIVGDKYGIIDSINPVTLTADGFLGRNFVATSGLRGRGGANGLTGSRILHTIALWLTIRDYL